MSVAHSSQHALAFLDAMAELVYPLLDRLPVPLVLLDDGGEVLFCGKPYPPIYEAALAAAAAARGRATPRSRVLAIGDSVRTDLTGAHKFGIDCLFVTAGIHAEELGGRAVRFDDWATEFSVVDIVISSTAAPHHILNRTKLEPLMKRRKNRSLLLIDIAVPRDIDPRRGLLPRGRQGGRRKRHAVRDDWGGSHIHHTPPGNARCRCCISARM